MRRVPATIVTGFLGAGKTSLVRHLIAHAHGRRLAVIVNEFGEVGIDRDLLLGCGDAGCAEEDIVELANGCICCTVAEDFLPTLERLLDRAAPPDHIVVETSGLALPKPLVQAFAWPEIRSRTTVDGVLAVIDAGALLAGEFGAPGPMPAHDAPIEEVFADQLAAADLIILNKIDLVAPAALPALRRDLKARLRAGVEIVAAQGGRVAPEVALGLAAAAEDDLLARPSLHDLEEGHDHDDFESLLVLGGPVHDEALFLLRLNRILGAPGVLRVKGFLDRPGRDRRQVVQAVGTRLQCYFDREWRAGEARQTRLVVIGEKGLDRGAVAGLLEP
jgi:cobalamin biosynthesis protein CobW